MKPHEVIDALDPTRGLWAAQRFRAAHTIDIVIRKDGKEFRYEGDFLKDVARALVPATGPVLVSTPQAENEAGRSQG